MPYMEIPMRERILEVSEWLRCGYDPQEAAVMLERIARSLPSAVQLDPLSKRQRKVFDWVRAFGNKHGRPPIQQEIADAFGYRSISTVTEHLGHLQDKGWITRKHNVSGITITEAAKNA